MAYTNGDLYKIIGTRPTWLQIIKSGVLDQYKKIEGVKVVFDTDKDTLRKLYFKHLKTFKGGRGKKVEISNK